jgi:hypothetical protein
MAGATAQPAAIANTAKAVSLRSERPVRWIFCRLAIGRSPFFLVGRKAWRPPLCWSNPDRHVTERSRRAERPAEKGPRLNDGTGSFPLMVMVLILV